MLMNTPQYVCHQFLCPQGEPQPPPLPQLPQDTLLDQQASLAQAPIKSLFPHWVTVHARFCTVHFKYQVSVSPVLWSSCNLFPLAFKAECSRSSSSQSQTPGLGCLTMGEPPQYNHSPACASPAQGVCDLVISQAYPLYCPTVVPSLGLQL